MAKLLGSLIALGALIALSSGSAIPMWEFLSRDEKMSHLYSMFAKQVSAHCKSAANELPVALCKRDLLVYGIGRLESMSDVHLDAMDPYQRGVNDLIWDSMVEGHASKPAKRAHHATDTPIREPIGQYERNPLFDDVIASGNRNDRLNEATAASSQQHHSYAMDMDSMYAASPYHSEQQPEPTNVHVAHAPSAAAGSRFLTGPMIIRVRPDGTPVEEDSARQLPRDDDREAMTIGRAKLPTVQQIASEFGAGSSETGASYRTASRTH